MWLTCKVKPKQEEPFVYKTNTNTVNKPHALLPSPTDKQWVTGKLQKHLGGDASGNFLCGYSGAQRVEENWISIDGRTMMRKKKHFLSYIPRIKARRASHIQPTQLWERTLWLRFLLPSKLAASVNSIKKMLSTNSQCNLWISFCPSWVSKRCQFASHSQELSVQHILYSKVYW